MLLFSCPLHGPLRRHFIECIPGIGSLILGRINHPADSTPEAKVERHKGKVGVVFLSHLRSLLAKRTRIPGHHTLEAISWLPSNLGSNACYASLHGQEKRPVQRSIKNPRHGNKISFVLHQQRQTAKTSFFLSLYHSSQSLILQRSWSSFNTSQTHIHSLSPAIAIPSHRLSTTEI